MSTLYQHTTLLGRVRNVKANDQSFEIHCRSGDSFPVFLTDQTSFNPLSNLDGISRDRYKNPDGFDDSVPSRMKKYLVEGCYVVIVGVLTRGVKSARFDATTLYLLYELDGCLFESPDAGKFVFETSSWWVNQILVLGDTWLQALFGQTGNYDYTLYQTDLGITYAKEPNSTQEMATLSRLIYGFSSAYLLSGNQRFLNAARAGVEYQREFFRSTDGELFFWAFGKKGNNIIYTSQDGLDRDTIPLYEQIYALSGLAQYYRITLEWEVLQDMERTVRSMITFFRDRTEYGGYFSSLDAISRTPDSEFLGLNRSRKNWNSIGDHIPAYLVNLILALEPLPEKASKFLRLFLGICRDILKETAILITEKFPEKDEKGKLKPYVFERFFQDWTPDLTWGWQQNRAIIGHNLKIAWNLTRVSFYFESNPDLDVDVSAMKKVAEHLANSMLERGAVDLYRSGCYDAVEREPRNGLPIEFTWLNTKDFWQQEQGILAYLILYGCTKKQKYLDVSREMCCFWNIFFLDRNTRGLFFRVADDGGPIIEGDYGDKGGHAISGYHAFELGYLAHIYTMTYVQKEKFRMYFKPGGKSRGGTINVFPDFLPKGALKIVELYLNGEKRPEHQFRSDCGQVTFDPNDKDTEIEVVFEPCA